MIVGSVLICHPLAFHWNTSIPGGYCGNFYALWLTIGVLNIVTDLVLLLLPMPCLYGLKLSFHKRLGLMGMFGAGLV